MFNMSSEINSPLLPEEMQTNEKLSTKKQLAKKEQYPVCPSPPPKPRKMTSRETNLKPIAISFSRPTALSPLFDPKNATSYMDQVFTSYGYLGEGSFGKVFQVRSREDRQLYAIKTIKANVCSKDRYAEVNNNEIVGVHPNCVQFFMAWEENTDMYMLLEHCDMSLADYSKENSNIPEEMLFNMLYDICKALEFLHNKNLLHLDVKPGNILLKDGFFKLADFGLLVDMKSDNRVSKSTLSDGDSKYLALEVLDGIYTPACDIFGLGMTLFELSTDLELPDHGPLWHRLRHNVFPNELYETVSLELRMIILKMTDSDYKNRPTAAKILSFATVKDIEKRDGNLSRTNFAIPYLKEKKILQTELPFSSSISTIQNNNSQLCRQETSDYGSMVASTSRAPGRKSLFRDCGNSSSTFMGLSDDLCDLALIASDSQTVDDSGTEVANENFDAQGTSSMTTSTPILKSRQLKKLPKARLNFE
ncbi:membrane-associated tyrosine- and threonine-specific cdc2-inhibitory kinase wee-1.3 [Cylas formicarius]|uniref:membrane-associated tyrosine- and threonine-specific cdc2-inhibitory kinase wee-1.3 n=1 Tax=Cylas formicarius TaxID=197179 RepID=UPI002958C445|nr:membrane-associated tyrosine- and threonine-specific cdc2-inhibitory kinase wee-1.3 [Cylas formicarius]